MKKNIRILHLGPDVEARGGIASVLQCLKNHSLAFERMGFDLEFVATTTKTSGQLLEKALAFLPAFVRLVGKILRSDVDIVHIHTALRGSLIRKSIFAATCALLRMPYVMHIHNGAFAENYRSCPKLARYCIQQVLRRAASVISLSRHSWNAMIELKLVVPERCQLIFNGIDDPLNGGNPARRESEQPVVLTFLGLISAAKGVPSLISAVGRMRRDIPSFSLRLGGIGDIEALRKLIKENDVADIATYVGWLDNEDKAATLAMTDVFVLPSRSEGFSVAIIEAMAYGTAIVSTAIPGVMDAVRADIDGVLIEPDNVGALTASLERLVVDSQERKRLGESARQRFLDSFTLDRMAMRLATVYGAVLARSGAGDCGSDKEL